MDIADVPRAGAETFHATFDVISASGRLVTTSLVGCNVRHFEKNAQAFYFTGRLQLSSCSLYYIYLMELSLNIIVSHAKKNALFSQYIMKIITNY